MNKTNLIIEKTKFIKSLTERIELGRKLRSKFLKSEFVNDELLKKYHLWESYNSEFLKTAFNIEDNIYKEEYDERKIEDHNRLLKGFLFIGTFGGLSPRYNSFKLRDKIDSGILILEKLVNRVDLIPFEKLQLQKLTGKAKISESQEIIISEEVKKEIEALIINNRINDALEKLKENCSILKKEVNVHLSNLNSINERNRLGVISSSEFNLNLIRIKAAVLELIE